MGNPPPRTLSRPMSKEPPVAAEAAKRSKPSYNTNQQPQRQPQQQQETLGRLLEYQMEIPARSRKTVPSPSSSSTSSWTGLGVLPQRHNQIAALISAAPRGKQRYRCGGRMAGCSVSLCSLRESSKVMHRPDHGVQPHTPSPDPFLKSKKHLAESYSSPSARKPPASPSASTRKSLRDDISRHVLSSLSSSSKAAAASRAVAAPPASPASSYATTYLGDSRSFRSSRRVSAVGYCECQQAVAQQSDRPLGCGFSRDGSLRTSALCACPDCGEVFAKAENLENHRAVRHAVLDLGPDDSSRSVVEIIFRSSWRLRPPRPPGGPPRLSIDRVLKINTSPSTLAAFESYRSQVRLRAAFTPTSSSSAASPSRNAIARQQRYPRCTADGNELLRFRAANLACGIGRAGGGTALCHDGACAVCTVIRTGLKPSNGDGRRGILTLASSGRAHEVGEWPEGVGNGERAMLVCRVVAGRVMKQSFKDGGNNNNVPMVQPAPTSAELEYDSVAVAAPLSLRAAGDRMDELYVFNPKAILPCFIVVYRCL